MEPKMEIRPECPNDIDAIGELVTSAFLGMPYADGDEAGLVEALRVQDALSVSLVAQLEGTIVGHVAFSPARTADGMRGWYALGPVAVLPARQRAGIGSKLVRTGLEAISELGAVGCILTGNPAYYSRFGFVPAPQSAPPEEPSEFFMVKLLRGQLPVGSIQFHEAFGGCRVSSSANHNADQHASKVFWAGWSRFFWSRAMHRLDIASQYFCVE